VRDDAGTLLPIGARGWRESASDVFDEQFEIHRCTRVRGAWIFCCDFW
jgi:hypothetical protein